MSPEQYKKFQDFQCGAFDQLEGFVEMETPFGNELFQRMMDAAFEVFKKHEKSEAAS